MYFYFAEFYYKRQMYRKALKYYNLAYTHGFNTNYHTLFKIGDIYEKLGDSRSALKYLKDAQIQKETPELADKILRIERYNPANKEYYSDTRIRKPQLLD